jgi:hypothetical protein
LQLNALVGSQTLKRKILVEKSGRIREHQEGWQRTSRSRSAAIDSQGSVMGQRTILLSDNASMDVPRPRLWRRRALIFGLISASTAALLLCPCDCAGQNPHAILLIAISVLIGGCAAFLSYRELWRRSDITAFLKAVIAIGIVIFGVYAEFAVAMDCIAWLARRGR